MSEKTELHLTRRPQDWEDVIGQEEAVDVLRAKIDSNSLPHCIMLAGPTGIGKTTLARIIASKIGCQPILNGRANPDYTEINAADMRDIDTVRGIAREISSAGWNGNRVWVLDEVVQFPKPSQQAFLKTMEDAPKHCYFILCTSTTDGLLDTFMGRCFQVPMQPLLGKHIRQILVGAMAEADIHISDRVLALIIESCKGSARSALQKLEAVATKGDEDGQLVILGCSGASEKEKQEFLAKALINGAKWSQIVTIIKSLDKAQWEGTRIQVLAYAAACLLGNNPQVRTKAALIIQCFRDTWRDSGQAGLIVSCWDACTNK